jgi:hypothetical protein
MQRPFEPVVCGKCQRSISAPQDAPRRKSAHRTPGKHCKFSILNKFNKADLLGFTTYPTLIYNSPSDIPLGYYEEISKNTNLKYIFSEIGWIRTDSIKGWEGSEIEQSKYMELLGKTNTKGYIWSFFYDQDVEKPFRYMGLRGVNDKSIDSVSEKAWQKLGK